MKRLYWLVLKELLGPWVFGVAIFTTLTITITLLFQMTEWIVRGVAPQTVALVVALAMPAVLVKTFAMSVLLAALLAFGRLSGESEIVALRAAGISIGRIMIPVAVFGMVVAMVAFVISETIVPSATQRLESMKADIAKKLRADDLRPTGYPLYDKQKRLIAQLNARDFSPAARTLRGVTLVVYDVKRGTPKFYVWADEMTFASADIASEGEWQIQGEAQVLSADGSYLTKLTGKLWPDTLPKVTPEQILAAMTKNLDTFSMAQYVEQIAKAKAENGDPKQIANLEYGYYNKIALPLAALIFGLLGAPLGIRNHRTGVAAGYMIAIVIIFGYFVLGNVMGVLATRGSLPAYVASFLPVVVGFVLAAITVHNRNK